MPDVYANVTAVAPAVLASLAEVIELRAADLQQRRLREAYFREIAFPEQARVVEVGCGPGPVARALAGWPGVGAVVGVDPSPFFLERARELAAGIANLRFVEGDARSLPLEPGSADVLVFHTTLCHVPEPETALAEACRVLAPGGWLAVFDGDYAAATCALGASDPLQACLDAAFEFLVHDRFLVRRLARLVAAAGFRVGELRSHGYVESPGGGYLLRMIERGADVLAATGRLGKDAAAALAAEAQRRSREGEFFGHIAYASLLAQKPV